MPDPEGQENLVSDAVAKRGHPVVPGRAARHRQPAEKKERRDAGRNAEQDGA